jgi:hypothetical protein
MMEMGLERGKGTADLGLDDGPPYSESGSQW